MDSIDLDALFPHGVVPQETRRNVLMVILTVSRKRQVRLLRESIVALLFHVAVTVGMLYAVAHDWNPWLCLPVAVVNGFMIGIWADIWNRHIKRLDNIDTALESLQ